MPEVKLSYNTIDPKSGSHIKKKRVVKIDEKDPRNSGEFHKFADLLGIQFHDRFDPAVSNKLSVIYNYIAEDKKTNDIFKILGTLKDLKKDTNLNNLQGKDLVTSLYRFVRLKMDNGKPGKDVKSSKQNDLKDDKQRAKELRAQREDILARTKKEKTQLKKETTMSKNELRERSEGAKNTNKIVDIQYKPVIKESKE